MVFLLAFGAVGCSGSEPAEEAAVPDEVSADCGGPTGEGQEAQAPGGSESSNAPAHVLESLDGNSMSLTDFAGQIVVLNFWASWCPPCRMEMPDLNEMNAELIESGAAVLVTVNLTDGRRETRDIARQYIEENGFGFIVLFDDQGLLAGDYNISSIPQTFILDRTGNVSSMIIGATTKEAILEKVNSV